MEAIPTISQQINQRCISFRDRFLLFRWSAFIFLFQKISICECSGRMIPFLSSVKNGFMCYWLVSKLPYRQVANSENGGSFWFLCDMIRFDSSEQSFLAFSTTTWNTLNKNINKTFLFTRSLSHFPEPSSAHHTSQVEREWTENCRKKITESHRETVRKVFVDTYFFSEKNNGRKKRAT